METKTDAYYLCEYCGELTPAEDMDYDVEDHETPSCPICYSHDVELMEG